jgi:hypothetical protein
MVTNCMLSYVILITTSELQPRTPAAERFQLSPRFVVFFLTAAIDSGISHDGSISNGRNWSLIAQHNQHWSLINVFLILECLNR